MNAEKSYASCGRQYSVLAPYYERLNSEVDYNKYADFIEREIKLHGKEKTEIVLELACGTGAVTRRLARRGFDMIGIDISENMLSEAYRLEHSQSFDSESVHNAGQRRRKKSEILYLCQDIRSFELYGTVSAAVCCLDSLNYLTKPGDLERCFRTLHNYLEPNGVFIFDVNTPYKFQNIFAGRDFIIEAEDVLCAWQNEYNEKSKICRFYLSLFTDCGNGKWIRSDEIQSERCYSMTAIKRVLKKCGFEIAGVYGDMNGTPADEKNERWFFTARRI